MRWGTGDTVSPESVQNNITVPATSWRAETRITNLTSNTRYNIFISATSSRNEEGARARTSITTSEFCCSMSKFLKVRCCGQLGFAYESCIIMLYTHPASMAQNIKFWKTSFKRIPSTWHLRFHAEPSLSC